MELASYDELLQQVECLKAENSNLRKELASNSKHLNQLGNEASNMKEVISNLQDSVTDRSITSSTLNNSNFSNGIPDNRNDNDNERLVNDCINSNGLNAEKAAKLQQLQRERARILQDIKSEEGETQWFISCLARIDQQLMQLSQANGFMSSSERVVWQQLQQDAGYLQETMQQKLGSKGEIERRQEARVHSIFLIDKQIRQLCPNQMQPNDVQDDYIGGLNVDDECCGQNSGPQTANLYLGNNGHLDSPSIIDEDHNITSVYNGSWIMDRVLWHSSPSSVGGSIHSFNHDEVGSYKSGTTNYRNRNQNQQQFGTKVEMVYSLLSMLRSQDKEDMSEKLLTMSASVDSCIAMRQSGCLPLLIELLHGSEENRMDMGRPSREIRRRAAQALHNIIRSHPDDKRGRREARVLKLLEQVREYCNFLRESDSGSDDEPVSPEAVNMSRCPVSVVALLMKLSFDEEHRHTMCHLGGLQALAELIQLDHETHGNKNNQDSITMRRYAGMALTNLTFGDGTNKALLCSNKPFMKALVAQLHSPSEDLRQVTASVLRNLSWRADQASKKALRDIGAVVILMKASMEAKKESTLKSILSALWNLSAHCSMNKADICAVDGALAFLVTTLTYRSPLKTHVIVENGGGILRNISSHIAVREDYRAILREHNCLVILLQHLRAPSLTIVSNACGTLWNLSARCIEDQQALWDLGAVSMLRNLVNSKHKMISMGSSAALKNLLQAKPGGLAASADKSMFGASCSLLVRKQKALEEELDFNLTETCENLDSPKTSPTHHGSDRKTSRIEHDAKSIYRPALTQGPYQLHGRMYHSVGGQLPPGKVSHSESKDSVLTTKSDSSHDRLKSLNMLLKHRQSHPVNENEETVIEQAVQVPQVVLESRIQYVMQEVTRQIAAESGETLDKKDNRSSRFLKSNYNQSGVDCEKQNDDTLLEKYSSITTMIEKLDLCDEDNNEQPVNYSLKYTEEADACNKNKAINGAKKTGNMYSDYAETDLDDPDQLTNYSLRYTEDTDTTDTFLPPGPKDEKPYFGSDDYREKGSSMHDDTVRIYCTEDTPLNFSTATSMSDLRDIRDVKLEKTNVLTETETEIKEQMKENPVNYCVEGTPVCFSRVSSLSSLNSNPDAVTCTSKLPSPTNLNFHQDKALSPEEAPKTKPCIVSNAKQNITYQDCTGKTVRFDEDPLVEETPLMFSRCSSLGSLSSFDQHSIHDDRSSVISDFSRRASEVVSPSDLPDSPGNTRPSTPPLSSHPRSMNQISGADVTQADDNDEVFKDTSRIFAVEGTPLQFSQATSLSSLTSPSSYKEGKDKDNKDDSIDNEANDDKMSDVEEDRDGDDLLAACINSAMPNNTRSNAPIKSNVKLVSKINILNTSGSGGSQRLRSSGIPVKSNNLKGPARSNAIPHSPLSVLVSSFDVSLSSADNNSSRDSNSDAGSVIDDDNMLAQCIRSGMPRTISSKTTSDNEKQNYGRNLSVDGNCSAGKSGSMSSSHFNGEEPPSASVMKELLAVTSKSDDKNLNRDHINKNCETNISKVEDKKNSKFGFNKLSFKSGYKGDGSNGAKSKTNGSVDMIRKDERISEDNVERYHQFQVEDTPVCFSANSSLSSLSVDYCDVESTASEQALLDECIHSGMLSQTYRAPPLLKNNFDAFNKTSFTDEVNLEMKDSSTKICNTSIINSSGDGNKFKETRNCSYEEHNRTHNSFNDTGGTDASLIDNIKPPSLMEDMTDMTSSTYSVTSLVSEALESKSESINSDFVNRVLKPAAEMFAKEMNISTSMGNGSGSLSFYEALENVNPPSMLMDVVADTLYEVTEVGTETVANGNDTDIEDDLPEDDKLLLNKKGARVDSAESSLSLEDSRGLKENAELVVTTLNEIRCQDLGTDESLSEDMLLDCETLSLVSNESDSSFTNSETAADNQGTCRGPKIVKPVSRSAVRPPKEDEKVVVVRGRRKVSHSRQQLFISSVTRFSSPKPKEMLVKPTKTSALRTTQSQQKVASDGQRKNTGRNSQVSSSIPPKPKSTSTRTQHGDTNIYQPKPPIKQATFTKDKPSQSSVPKISPTKTRIPTLGQSSGRWAQPINGFREDKLLNEQSKVADKRGQSLSPVSRGLYSSRVLMSRKPLASNLAKTSPTCSNISLERPTSKSPVQSKHKQLGSPKRSSSNASLCSSTSSSTTSNSVKSIDNKKDIKRTTSKLNNIWKGNNKTGSGTSSTQLKRSSTYEKLPSGGSESKSSNGPTAAIVPPFNYNGPKVKQNSHISSNLENDNAEQLSDDEEGKQQCLVTYV